MPLLIPEIFLMTIFTSLTYTFIVYRRGFVKGLIVDSLYFKVPLESTKISTTVLKKPENK